jgi:hypothetical protein
VSHETIYAASRVNVAVEGGDDEALRQAKPAAGSAQDNGRQCYGPGNHYALSIALKIEAIDWYRLAGYWRRPHQGASIACQWGPLVERKTRFVILAKWMAMGPRPRSYRQKQTTASGLAQEHERRPHSEMACHPNALFC